MIKQHSSSLQKLIKENRFIYTAGAYDALSAKMIEKAGFDAVFTSGYAISASHLGLPDAELYTMTENVLVVQNIVNAVSIPVIADADTGYGNAINVMRTVQSFERAGVSGIVIEDQVVPKRCPLGVSVKSDLITLEEAVGKIKAAVDARSNQDFVIIARTDAEGDEAVERAKAYIEAGADFIQPLSYVYGDENGVVEFANQISVPLSLQMVGLANKGIEEEFFKLSNCKFIHFPLVPLLLTTAALEAGLKELIHLKTTKGMDSNMMTTQNFKKLIGFSEVEALQHKYLP